MEPKIININKKVEPFGKNGGKLCIAVNEMGAFAGKTIKAELKITEAK